MPVTRSAAKKPLVVTLDDAAEQTVPLFTLPPEIFIDNIIPLLSSDDIMSLSRTSKLLYSFCKDPSVWRTKMGTDFSFFSQQVAVGSGKDDAGWYERVYLGLKKPRTYLWGSTGEARLGSLSDIAARTRAARMSFVRKVEKPMNVSDWFNGTTPAPVQGTSTPNKGVPADRASMVDLQAGGWSFAARDSKGGVWVWGKLDGTSYYGEDNWESASAIVEEATKIPLPCAATQIATGRRHLVVLDSDNLIWEMKSWGKAYHHTAHELTAPSQTGAGNSGRGPYIVQIDAGWDHSACLTAAGEVHVWRPFLATYKDALTPDSQLNGPLGTSKDRKLRWGTVGPDVVFTLPPLPDRPTPPSSDQELIAIEEKFTQAEKEIGYEEFSEQKRDEHLRIIKIAATSSSVLALRANGEVWVGAPSEDWQYLPHFSSPAITHISAQWANFFTYATSTPTNPTSAVFHGRCEHFTPGIGSTLLPQPLTGVDGLHVIRIVAGDWHFAALTADGSMYTWGKNDWGQCGIPESDMPRGAYNARSQSVTKPTRVTFPPDGDRPAFVFGITAAGMHTGALVLGHPRGKGELPPIPAKRSADHDLDNEEEARREQDQPQFVMPPGRFRIGFAGRGLMRGGGLGTRGRGSRGGGPPA